MVFVVRRVFGVLRASGLIGFGFSGLGSLVLRINRILTVLQCSGCKGFGIFRICLCRGCSVRQFVAILVASLSKSEGSRLASCRASGLGMLTVGF